MLQSNKKMNEKHVLGVLERFCVTLKNKFEKPYWHSRTPSPPSLSGVGKAISIPCDLDYFSYLSFFSSCNDFSPSVRHSSPLRCTKLWHWDDPSSSWPQSKVCQSSCICKRELDAGFVCVVVFRIFASMLLLRNTQNVIFYQGWWTRSK